MTDRLLMYHCIKNHITRRSMPDDIDILNPVTCDQCGQESYLLGPKQIEVETQEPPTIVNRPVWFHDYEQQPVNCCLFCDGKFPCACRLS
jgi:hypothetical protein